MATRDLLSEALQLSPSERGRIVRELISSLDRNSEEDSISVERAWVEEIEERAAAAASNDTPVRDLGAVCEELRAKRRIGQ